MNALNIILIATLVIVLILIFFIIKNLLNQIEKSEDIITEYENFIIKQSEAIEACNIRLNEVDNKGIFKADDEIGWMFKEFTKIQEALNEFTLR